MEKETFGYTHVMIFACFAVLVIVFIISLCLSACSSSQMKFWEKEGELLEHYAVESVVD